MINPSQEYASLKALRSTHIFSKNIHQQSNDQEIYIEDKNGPVLNPQKKQSHLQFNKVQNHFIEFQSIKKYDMKAWIYELYDSTSYQKASLYGFNIRILQNQLKNHQKTSLKVLWGLYQTLNWQSLSLADLQAYINNMPQSQEEVQEISLQNNKIKLNKVNMSLQLDILTDQFTLVPKKQQLNRIDGRNYEKSLTKINHQFKSYQFKGPILQIQSNHLMIAVRTSTQIYIINPDGKMKAFNIIAKDITVRQNRCYFAKISNTIGSIFIQTSYIPKLNEVALEQKIFSDELREGQFFVSNSKLTLIVDINIEQESIYVRKIQGQKNRFKLSIEPQGQQCLVNKKAFLSQNYLYVLIFLGIGKNITRIQSYKFFLNY